MKNATTALSIAASVLLGVLLIGLGLYIRDQMNKPYRAMQDDLKVQQIRQYNRSYEVYNKNLLRGTDVLSVLNRAWDQAQAQKLKIHGKENVETVGRKVDKKTNEPVINVGIKFKPDEKDTNIVFKHEINIVAFDVEKGRIHQVGGDLDIKFGMGEHGENTLGDVLGIKKEEVPQKLATYLEKTTITENNITVNDDSNIEPSKQIDLIIKREENGEIVSKLNETLPKFLGGKSGKPKITKRNPEVEKTKKNNWLEVEYITPVYQFIKMNFKCTSVKYDSLGYISEIIFEQI